MKTFSLHRHKDHSGSSGISRVAEGVEFSDGRCALRWLTNVSSAAFYDSIADVVSIHGHDGSTLIVWDAQSA